MTLTFTVHYLIKLDASQIACMGSTKATQLSYAPALMPRVLNVFSQQSRLDQFRLVYRLQLWRGEQGGTFPLEKAPETALAKPSHGLCCLCFSPLSSPITNLSLHLRQAFPSTCVLLLTSSCQRRCSDCHASTSNCHKDHHACLESSARVKLQAGGPEGVHAAEVTSLITGTKEGIPMRVLPRYS